MVYALGGGSGHLMRSLALARAAAVRGHQIRILTNSPLARDFRSHHCLLKLPASIAITPLDASWDRDRLAGSVGKILLRGRYDLLVVDTFPRGLAGELADALPRVAVPRVLVHRHLNPRYVDRFDLRAMASQYQRVLMPGEQGALRDLPRAVATEPWLLADADELLAPAEARRLLRIPPSDGRPLLLVSGCGKPDEWRKAAVLAQRIERDIAALAVTRFVCLAIDVDPSADPSSTGARLAGVWPLLMLLRGAEVLIGSGGYNTVYEARAAGVPLLAVPQPRLYDSQSSRLLASERTTKFDLPARIRGLLRQPHRNRETPDYVNGVHRAVELIEDCLRRG